MLEAIRYNSRLRQLQKRKKVLENYFDREIEKMRVKKDYEAIRELDSEFFL